MTKHEAKVLFDSIAQGVDGRDFDVYNITFMIELEMDKLPSYTNIIDHDTVGLKYKSIVMSNAIIGVYKSDEDELCVIFIIGSGEDEDGLFAITACEVVENYLLADSLAPYLQQDILKHIQEEDPKTYERATMKVVDKLIETTSQNRL
jgi:hypothetical protein